MPLTFNAFPLLIKLIDANDKLSVQVHPDDEYAKANGLDAGKTAGRLNTRARTRAQMHSPAPAPAKKLGRCHPAAEAFCLFA